MLPVIRSFLRSSDVHSVCIPTQSECVEATKGCGCSKYGFEGDSADLWVSAEQHPVLLELLEVPQLMDACVRNGNYDDALDLRAFVAKMALLHADLKVRC